MTTVYQIQSFDSWKICDWNLHLRYIFKLIILNTVQTTDLKKKDNCQHTKSNPQKNNFLYVENNTLEK